MNAGGSTSSEIASWVTENFTAQTVDGVTLYDLSGGVLMTATAMLPERSGPRAHPCSTSSSRSSTRRAALVDSVETCDAHLQTLPFEHRVTIADNASTDAHQPAGAPAGAPLPRRPGRVA